MIKQANFGDIVKIKYTGKLRSGDVFEAIEDSDPEKIKLGDNNKFPFFEKCLVGMVVGEKKKIAIPPEAAFGPICKELVVNINKNQIPDSVDLEKGKRIELKFSGGSNLDLLIKEIHKDSVTVDANHPLAGETLIFDVEILDIQQDDNATN